MAEEQTLATLKAELAAQEAALWKLTRGDLAVRVTFGTDTDTQTLEYRQVDRAAVEATVADLRNRIAALEQGRTRRGPIYLEF